MLFVVCCLVLCIVVVVFCCLLFVVVFVVVCCLLLGLLFVVMCVVVCCLLLLLLLVVVVVVVAVVVVAQQLRNCFVSRYNHCRDRQLRILLFPHKLNIFTPFSPVAAKQCGHIHHIDCQWRHGIPGRPAQGGR